MRQVTFYQFSNSDIRSIGVAQAVATFFFAIGTFFLSNYIDFNKDLLLAAAEGKAAPEFLARMTTMFYWGWLLFWGCGALAFAWQGIELRRIKREHDDQRIGWLRALWRKHVAG